MISCIEALPRVSRLGATCPPHVHPPLHPPCPRGRRSQVPAAAAFHSFPGRGGRAAGPRLRGPRSRKSWLRGWPAPCPAPGVVFGENGCGWRPLALVASHFHRSGSQLESPFKVVVFLRLYLGHGLRSRVSQGRRMSVSLGLREPDRLLLENIAI